jgi:hypothetical protein
MGKTADRLAGAACSTALERRLVRAIRARKIYDIVWSRCDQTLSSTRIPQLALRRRAMWNPSVAQSMRYCF